MYLLDTHTLLWALFKEDFLSVNAKKVILDDNDIFVSIVSLWEIAIKQSIGKLEMDESIETIVRTCKDEDFCILPIKPSHLDHLKNLPQIHGDPFDRLIIAQAAIENLVIVTKEAKIPTYNIRTIW
ncbi:MAG: type II toxin-antitoxin system VapC family toxin [Lachnospiraceae bacterium]|nr:type II toxin-antitoxin system VapC family toxin [Lachnospiraceae bacterium]MDE7000946.1 type II toxin-antitoxin system VapC family toxin [Lachnospiraceae bacterium]